MTSQTTSEQKASTSAESSRCQEQAREKCNEKSFSGKRFLSKGADHARSRTKAKQGPVAWFFKGAVSFIEGHQRVSAVLLCLITAACLLLLFWFTIFSGLGLSADFIYNQF